MLSRIPRIGGDSPAGGAPNLGGVSSPPGGLRQQRNDLASLRGDAARGAASCAAKRVALGAGREDLFEGRCIAEEPGSRVSPRIGLNTPASTTPPAGGVYQYNQALKVL